MCDYCDCRSHAAIASLSAEHDELLDLLAQLRSAVGAGDEPTVARLGAEIHERLVDHAAREEQGVFTELRAAGIEGDYVARFEADHAAIHAAADPGDLAAALAEHIHLEEYDLFPSAHQILGPAAWDRVDAVHAGRGPAPPAPS